MAMRRFRISLATALLLTAIAAMGVVIAQLWREVGPLRAEVRQMGTELGHLTIEDPNRAYGIQVRQYDKDFWRWRIYLTPGPWYSVHCEEGMLPSRGTKPLRLWLNEIEQRPDGGDMMRSGSGLEGEQTWEVSLKQDRKGEWTIQTKPDGGSIGFTVKDDWLAGMRLTDSSLKTDAQSSFAPDEPILLLYIPKPDTKPALGGGTSYSMPSGPSEGIVMWIEQQPTAPATATVTPPPRRNETVIREGFLETPKHD